jgi:organic hydroperoxide reductase OsmC/OhrA
MGNPPTRLTRLGPISKRRNPGKFLQLMKTIHIAEMIAQGGRDGTVEAPDAGFLVELSSDEQQGSVTPEHLFAGAYAAVFWGH